MAKHRMPRAHWRKVLAVLVSLSFAGALAVSVPAGADTGPIIGQLRTSGSDGYDGGACSFNVQGVNASAGTVTAQFSGQSKPVAGNVLGYLQIAHNEITCVLLDPAGNFLTSIHGAANTADVGTSIILRTVPRHPYYILCGVAQYTLRSGSVFNVAVPCATGPTAHP
jgi:hypothetical protein